ncbi:hypothetical protein K1718_07855 [Roseibium porphyridii]|uniref:CMD domain protein n=1 Tax=Roseibium porphyridii TaxID=2866279 RepID=A0ABY8F6X9_9HYPH|nr:MULTISPECIES: hypothetical protein [Stappiaceae]QFT30623.1 hypothetical protein FIV00_09065 [Labrenzia sp. THAF82]WFE91257.1 hypothetical protein K1718_07855 [Roseibium sp. KMA01]
MSDLTILTQAGVAPDSTLSRVVSMRGNIIGMTQSAEEAVLRPKETGAFPHDLRAAIAARVSRLAGDEALTAYYVAQAGQYAALGELGDPCEQHADLAVVLSFVDKIANQTRDAAANDISDLQEAGVADADIVRLCELVAFLAFQIRVISGLRLMNGKST